MTAEGDGFAVLVTAIGIAAIAGFEIDQDEMTRHDFDASEFYRLRGFDLWHGPHEPGGVAFARLVRQRRLGIWFWAGPIYGPALGQIHRPVATAKSHAL